MAPNPSVSRSIELLDWGLFRAFPIYLQFVVALMVLYAAAMTALTALIAVRGSTQAAVTLTVAAFVWAFALVAVPTLLGPRYAPTAGE